MPFEPFHVATTKTGAGTGAKATLTKPKSGKSPAALQISLTTAVAAELGFLPGDKLDVMVGTGADHGLIRLRKNNSTGTAEVCSKKAGGGFPYLKISLGHVPNFVDRRESARHINFEKIDGTGWVEFVMPKWADETGERAKPGLTVPPRIGTPGPQGVPRTKTVTGSIMGDPPPGRREEIAAIE